VKAGAGLRRRLASGSGVPPGTWPKIDAGFIGYYRLLSLKWEIFFPQRHWGHRGLGKWITPDQSGSK